LVPERVRGLLWYIRKAATSAVLARCGLLSEEQKRDGRVAAVDLHVALGGSPIRLVTVEGVRLSVDLRDRGVGRLLYFHRAYEPAETHFLKGYLKPGMVFLDVGANIGYYTSLAGQLVGPAGRVVAVEPEPHNFSLLTRNIAANGLRNVAAENAGLGAQDGTASLHCSASNFGDHRITPTDLPGHTTRQVVPITTMDRLLGRLGVNSVDLIKIDVQGYEHAVAGGMTGTLAANPAVAVLAEFWPFGIRQSGGDPRQFFGVFTAAGFEARLLTKEGGVGKRVDYEGALALLPPLEPESSYINLLFRRSA
jgi:FkbM family methyltransferase